MWAIRDAGFGDPVALGEALYGAGCVVVQLRCKGWSDEELAAAGRRLVAAARAHGALLVVNDRVEVAAAVGAHGVHLGQEDGPVEAARRALGPGALIGRSTHDLAQVAATRGEPGRVDYIGFGPVFGTSTKVDAQRVVGIAALAAAVVASAVPVVAIGGITADNLPKVKSTGVHGWAIVSALLRAPDLHAAVAALSAR